MSNNFIKNNEPMPRMRTVTGMLIAELLSNVAKNDEERLKILEIAVRVVGKDFGLDVDLADLINRTPPETKA